MTLAAEEGMIRNIANRVVSDGIGAFDAELGSFQAAGQIINQVYQRIAYEAISNPVTGYPIGVPTLTLTPCPSLKGVPYRGAVVPGLQPRVSPSTV